MTLVYKVNGSVITVSYGKKAPNCCITVSYVGFIYALHSEATGPGLPNLIYLSHLLTPDQPPTLFHIPPVETHQKEPNESLESIPESEKCKLCF